MKPLAIALSGAGSDLGMGEMVGMICVIYNVRLFGIGTMNPPVQQT
jgi:hypothetical protein